MDNRKKVAIACFALGGTFLLLGFFYSLHERRFATGMEESEEVVSEQLDETEQNRSEPEITESEITEPEITVEETSEEVPEEELLEPEDNPYQEYFDSNSDMVAWINIPDTVVDYPVMWTPEDENYYLQKGFDKQPSKAGCLILDTDSSVDPFTTNLIIHGHNIKHKMFGDLSLYEKEEYRDEHPYIYFSTRTERHVFEVIAAFRSQVYYNTDVCFKFYQFFQADTVEEFSDFYDNVKELSFYENEELTAMFGDRFVTLSTCAYHVDNGRFVVVAKEIDVDKLYK